MPLSYEIYSLKEPTKQVGTNISTEMEIVEYELKGYLPPENYKVFVDLFDDGIGAATQIAGEFAAIYNGAGTRYVIYNAITGTVSESYDIKDANGPMGATSFDGVGAALRAFNTQIYVFNEAGTAFEIITYSSAGISSPPDAPFGTYIEDEASGLNRIYFPNDSFTSNQVPDVPEPINVYGDSQGCSEYPFLGDGIKAAVRRNHIANHIYGFDGFSPLTAYLTVNYYYSASSNGSKFSRLEYYNPSSTSRNNFRCWKPEGTVSELRGAVEAACKIQINSSEILLYFTPDGRMTVRDLDFDEEGPWAL